MRETFDTGLFQLSPESWSEEARKRNKDVRIHYTNAELEANIEAIARRGLYSQVYFGYVMPYDTKEAVYGTIAYVDSLNQRFGQSCEARNLRFSTDPGSPAFQRPEKYNITLHSPDLRSYLAMMSEANRRGYLNNLQLFKVNGMSDVDNYLASQMPPCFYQIQERYPETVRKLLKHIGFAGLLSMIEQLILLPRWNGRLDPVVHTFDADPLQVHRVLEQLVDGVRQPFLRLTLAREFEENVQPLLKGAPPPIKAPEALRPAPFTNV
jgi:hypothetical protein